jgi:biopolymer transport protein ExbD
MRFESTAMSDIIFLLLIFFLLSSSFIMQVGTQIELPKEAKPQSLEKNHVLVTIEADGAVFVNEEPVSMNDLSGRIGELLEGDPERAVIVRGDEAVSLGRTVEVMDVAKRMGARKLAIATQPTGT